MINVSFAYSSSTNHPEMIEIIFDFQNTESERAETSRKIEI